MNKWTSKTDWIDQVLKSAIGTDNSHAYNLQAIADECLTYDEKLGAFVDHLSITEFWKIVEKHEIELP